jgi:hypothetical protein
MVHQRDGLQEQLLALGASPDLDSQIRRNAAFGHH